MLQGNRKFVNFLDITLNLEIISYRLQLNDSNEIFYINIECSHPASIIKINRIKFITVTSQQRNIQDISKTIQGSSNESRVQTRNTMPIEKPGKGI